jgi:lysophospholipase L1-like esterase
MKRVLGPLAVVAASTLLAVAAGELVVRALFKDSTVMFPRYHTDYRYGEYTLRGIRPNARFRHTSVDGSWEFVTNSKGLRDSREFAYEKPAGTLRVLALGDSHTQGYEARQQATYSAVLERYLGARGLRAEVLNAGVSGFSTAEALAYLENEGYRYGPDVVVLGFYANDFEDNLKAGLYALEDDRLVMRKYEHIPGVRLQNLIYGIPGIRWLGENSYFYSLLFNHVWAYMKSALHERAVSQAAIPGAVGAENGEFEFALATRDEHPPYAAALTLALIERMQRFCRERGMRLLVVDIPQPHGAYRLRESLAAPAMKRLGEVQAEVIGSRALFGEVDSAAEMHLPAGHRHISEFTHTLIGVELGRRILKR